ncbi:MAG: hypothetical protein Q4E88_01730 [Coriobacteriia bacterium]|nr:hypothetical protein [Coriobacteriia bacterium]
MTITLTHDEHITERFDCFNPQKANCLNYAHGLILSTLDYLYQQQMNNNDYSE